MKITDNCFAILGLGLYPPWIVNAGFVVGSERTLVIDTGPNYLSAQTIYGYAKNVKPGNEIIVVNTEKHLDHIGGNCFFKDMGIIIYGHEHIKRFDCELMDERAAFNQSILNDIRRDAHEEQNMYQDTRIINPDLHTSNGQIFNLGGGIDAAVTNTFGHTSTNISIYVGKENVLYCGDCIVSGYIPNLEAGDKADWRIWLNSLKLISKMQINHIVPGHGKVLHGAEIKSEIERITNILEQAIKNNKAPT